MSAHTEFDLGSLIWVKGEIDQALEKARQSLETYASKNEAAELKFAQTHLHQVRGAIEMVGLSGAARFSEELEIAVGTVERGEADAAVLPVVAEAAASLAQYLESLINGSTDQALKLLPAYRRVRAARGEANTSGADLFFPTLSAQLPAGLAPVSLDDAGLAQLQKNARARFEAGLLKWLKDDRRGGALLMVQALLGIARSQSSTLQRGFWWVAAALVEGTIDNRAKLDLELKPIFARLNQQLKRLVDGGKVAERLYRDVLYVVASMDTNSVHCAAVNSAFALKELMPDAALEDDAQQLASMQAARELREVVNQAKDNWARIGGGNLDKLGLLQHQLTDMAKRGASLNIAGFDTLLAELLRLLGTLKSVPAEDQALEIATALLLLENALLVFPEQSREFPAQSSAMVARLQGKGVDQEVTLLDEVSRRAQERLLLGQVAQEIQANLSQIEQLLDDFFRDPASRDELKATDATIRQIRGALTMLDEQDALYLLDHCAETIRRCQSADFVAAADELEFLAEALSSLGFYIEALKREDAERNRLIAPWLHKIRGDEPQAPAPIDAESSDAVFDHQPEPEPEPLAFAPEPQPEPVIIEAVPAAPAPVSDAAVDAELLEVYLEEAVEVLGNIEQHLAIVREQPNNKDALTVIRRSFHTLKGSGRMVGLNQLGEVAWAVEQVMNKWLQDEKRASGGLLRLIDTASAGFSRWVEELKDHGAAQVEASALFALAEQLKSGNDPDVAEAAVSELPAMVLSEAVPQPAPEALPAELHIEAVAEPAPVVDALPDLVLDIEPPQAVAEAAPAADDAEHFALDFDSAPAAASIEPQLVDAGPLDASAESATVDFHLDLEADTPLLPGSIEPVYTEPVPEPTELQIGDISISKALFGIFLDEAYRHFATLNEAFIDFRAHGEVRPEFVHAAHTLCGIANTTGFTSLGELGHAIELALIARQSVGGEPSLEERETFAIAIDKVGAMLGLVGRHHMPADELQLVALLNAMSNRLKDDAQAGSMQTPAMVELPELATDEPADTASLVEPAQPPAHADIQLDELALDFDLQVPAEAGEVAALQPVELPVVDAPLPEAAEPIDAVAGEVLASEDLSLEIPDLTLEMPADEALLPPGLSHDAVEEEVHLDLDAVVDALPGADAPADALPQEAVQAEPETIDLSLPETAGEDALLITESELVEVEPQPAGDDAINLSVEELPAVALPLEAPLAEVPEDTVLVAPAEDEAGHDLPLDAVDAIELNVLPVIEAEATSEAGPDSEPEALPEAELFEIEAASAPELDVFASAPDAMLAISLPVEDEALLLPATMAEAEAALTDVALAPVDEAMVIEAPREVLDAEAFAKEEEPADLPDEVLAPSIDVPLDTAEVAELPTIAHEADSVGSVMPLANDRWAEITAIDELDEQLLPIFIEEAQELMPQIAADLRKLREDATDHEAQDSLKRVLHTLKGSARMAGAMRLGEATHNLETRLLNTGDGLLPAVLDELDLDYDLIVDLQDRLINGEPAAPAEAAAEQAETVLPGVAVPSLASQGRVPGAPQQLGLSDPEAGKTTVRVRADLVDRLVNQAGEVAIARTRIESEMLSLKRSLLDLTDNVGRLRNQLREIEIQAESQMQSRLSHSSDLPDFDPLEFDRFSRLQELTRFMAESVNDVATVQHNLLKNLDESSAALQQQSRLTRDLQQELMRVRMVPFSSLSERLYRLVRQTGKETGKKVNLELRGGRVEIDRSVLEKMVSPFEHMLRNAIDHGLETTEVRTGRGKNEFGEILVEARQEGNELVLNLRDDGAGLDLKRIREKGIEKGLIDANEQYSDSHLMNLIFEAGFSTASAVTQLSGRGIGMDVVKSEIEDLGGRVEVDSVAGQGTTFTIHLPLTLAVTQTVLVKVGEKTFAIPSTMVEQVQEVKQPALEKLYQTRQVEWMGNQYPFHYLPRLLGDNETQPEQKRYNTVLLLRSGIHRVALHLDQLMKNQEVVVKNIGPQLVRVAGVAGATVLGNGEIVLILNPLALLQRRAEAPVADFDSAMAASQPAPEELLRVAPVVMVVDDSLTVRKITGRLLAREGYQVVTAKDGVDALQQLQDIRPAVMLLDVEMPRMDGFELTRNLRANADTRDIPIIMITSRTADKHKNYAFELGVNAFLGKPYQEDELLERIRQLISEE
ncbi:Hpt domain-containing protein [Chitinimonas sp.]|uniref:Hpt domain-containing protein n=1 Tax=Chitinimonas sp. TaxID=1934313 RepID=UPI0035B1180F